jgi:hypothetical protein
MRRSGATEIADYEEPRYCWLFVRRGILRSEIPM